MKKLRIYQVDAFASEVFKGNPAAVVPLETWLDDATMQSIALENNLSETAFFVREGDGFHIRWFTPVTEVELCGHATLASGYVVLDLLERGRARVAFASKSGELVVSVAHPPTGSDDASTELAMHLPSWPPTPCAAPPKLVEALGIAPREMLAARDYLAVYDSEAEVRALAPNMSLLATLDRDVIVTAPSGEAGSEKGVDFVSRFFAPRLGILEDPVTGSAHCILTPYWAKRLGKTKLRAFQCSSRGGELACEARGASVVIAGRATLYMEGTIYV